MIKTQYLKTDARYPDAAKIHQAAQLISRGELVAFPTETVYGLGADAMQASAVEKIFAAKGRPAQQPLLVHISRMEHINRLVTDIPSEARQLMERFWPGPLSIILPAREQVPEIVRGGMSGVGLRMPSHPVAIALINAAGPLAAPSANLYGRPSPTSADHVKADLDGRIAAVLDAGETGSGLESTVVDLNGDFRILRRGGIPVEDIEAIIGRKFDQPDVLPNDKPAYISPVQVILNKNINEIIQKTELLLQSGKSVGLVRTIDSSQIYPCRFTKEYMIKMDVPEQSFFSILRNAENEKIDALLFEPIDEDSGVLSQAIIDRINRAAAKQN
jgi:L-threonylcarbamoyladenylate synthase